MWQCRCGVKLPIAASYPIRCTCGLVDYGDRVDDSGEHFKCVYRGEVVGEIDCGCEGDLRVFTCKVNGLCTLRALKPGEKTAKMLDQSTVTQKFVTCNVCGDRT